jgi:Flp pilus assembly protein TadG
LAAAAAAAKAVAGSSATAKAVAGSTATTQVVASSSTAVTATTVADTTSTSGAVAQLTTAPNVVFTTVPTGKSTKALSFVTRTGIFLLISKRLCARFLVYFNHIVMRNKTRFILMKMHYPYTFSYQSWYS